MWPTREIVDALHLLTALNATMRRVLCPDTLRGVTSFNGIVVAKRKITLPRYSRSQRLRSC